MFLMACVSGFESLLQVLAEDYENQNLCATVVHSRQANHPFVPSKRESTAWNRVQMSKLLSIMYCCIVAMALTKRGKCRAVQSSSSRLVPKSFSACWLDFIDLGSEEMCMKQLFRVLNLAEKNCRPPPCWPTTILILHSNFIPPLELIFPTHF